MAALKGLGRPWRLGLAWRLLAPYLVLILVLGSVGAFAIVHQLAKGAQSTFDQELLQRSVQAEAALHDRELYLLESANFAANVHGMAGALHRSSPRAVASALQSVVALKTDLELVTVVDTRGEALVDFTRSRPRARPHRDAPSEIETPPFVSTALHGRSDVRTAGLLRSGSRWYVGVASPVCGSANPCRPLGAALVAVSVDRLVLDAAAALRPTGAAVPSVTLYDVSGAVLATSGSSAAPPPSPAPSDEIVRVAGDLDGQDVQTAYSTFTAAGRPIARVGVTMPTGPAFAAVHSATWRLVGVLLAVMAGTVVIGGLLSRFILAQLRPLIEANRALGQGDLSARAPILRHDELGELAVGVNQMAAQLQASHESLGRTVEQRTEEIRRLLRERTELFAALSHDLRTPLAVILNEAEVMRHPGFASKGPQIADVGRVIEDSAAQLLDLVNDILKMASSEAAQVDLNLGDVDVAAEVATMRPTIEGLSRGNSLSLDVDVPMDLPHVRADARRLRECVLNLVDNAVKYTPAGGAVHINASARNGHVRVCVADTGIGIPPQVGERIFEPFYRVDTAQPQRRQPSSGLGLAFTKRLVEAQGGSITFTSTPGEGSAFTIAWPVSSS